MKAVEHPLLAIKWGLVMSSVLESFHLVNLFVTHCLFFA